VRWWVVNRWERYERAIYLLLEHVQGAVTLSASERRVLKGILSGQREMHLVEDGPLYDKIAARVPLAAELFFSVRPQPITHEPPDELASCADDEGDE